MFPNQKTFTSPIKINSARIEPLDNGYTTTMYVRSADPNKYENHEFKMFFTTFAQCNQFQLDVELKVQEINDTLAAEVIEGVQ